MTTLRHKRPRLERDHPIRAWSTLFGLPDESRRTQGASLDPEFRPEAEPPAVGKVLTETVELGYRVIDNYLRQGKHVAEAFGPTTWTREEQDLGQDVPALARRVMQYGWDFAGLWFELWSRIAAGDGTVQPLVGPFPTAGAAPKVTVSPAHAPGQTPEQPRAETVDRQPLRVAVSVASRRATTTSLDLRPGPSALTIHALRPEGHDGPAIRTISFDADVDRGTIAVKVVVDPEQPPGIYNGMIVDAVTNLPRGTLSLEIHTEAKSES